MKFLDRKAAKRETEAALVAATQVFDDALEEVEQNLIPSAHISVFQEAHRNARALGLPSDDDIGEILEGVRKATDTALANYADFLVHARPDPVSTKLEQALAHPDDPSNKVGIDPEARRDPSGFLIRRRKAELELRLRGNQEEVTRPDGRLLVDATDLRVMVAQIPESGPALTLLQKVLASQPEEYPEQAVKVFTEPPAADESILPTSEFEEEYWGLGQEVDTLRHVTQLPPREGEEFLAGALMHVSGKDGARRYAAAVHEVDRPHRELANNARLLLTEGGVRAADPTQRDAGPTPLAGYLPTTIEKASKAAEALEKLVPAIEAFAEIASDEPDHRIGGGSPAQALRASAESVRHAAAASQTVHGALTRVQERWTAGSGGTKQGAVKQ